jgi:hypothetical protein
LRKGFVVALVVLSISGIVMAMFRGPLAGTSDSLWPMVWIAWPIVGGVILLKKPGNRIGIACLAIGGIWGVMFGLQAVVLDVPPAVGAWMELTYTVFGVLPWLVIAWILAHFPTGWSRGRLERIVSRAAWLIGAWGMLGFLLSPLPLTDTGLSNPLGGADLPVLSTITSDSAFFLVIGLAVLAVISLIRRMRHSSGIERLQYRWLLLGGSLFVLVSVGGQILPDDSVLEYLWLLGGSAIPISIGVAVVRYRLFEIDRLLSRTVTYVVVVGVLAVMFAGVVTMASSILQSESDLAVAASTLTVAAMFNPLRRRVQGWVDRRFNRSRYDAERVMTGFSGSLRDEVDPERLVLGWVNVVSDTMQPAAAGVWVRAAE